MSDPIRMAATLPPTKTAIKIDGQDGEAQITLLVPGSDLPAVLELAAYGRETVLRVTVEVEVE